MSAFGGDSWGREAQHRKRRVDDLIADSLTDSTPFKKLSNGKYACLVCPNNPIFDSSLMLSMHNKGARHVAAESRLKEKELAKQQEINTRIALSSDGIDTAITCNTSKPLIEKTWNITSQLLHKQKRERNATNATCNVDVRGRDGLLFSSSAPSVPGRRPGSLSSTHGGLSEKSKGCVVEKADKALADRHLDFSKRQEKELKFTAAGWKRDGHGKWYRDENVEFDSDEEDPNVSLCET
ncbi:hypothetical protein Syun_015422 [Stephania yunnanensis]|uniref:Sodium channel modifier 1 n=1 Tax=Stephania yunnanensis TaxID=152371 RepID=A0AAP0JLB5_9MAGN